MSGIKKFETLEEACKALGVTEVTDANRAVLEGLVRKGSAPVSDNKKELLDLAEEVGLLDGATVTVLDDDGEEVEVTFAKNKETSVSLKVLLAFHMKNTESDKLDAFLAEQNWVFSEFNGRLYRLKRKATPVSERTLPVEGTVGYAVMGMVGDPDYANMEFAEMTGALKKMGHDTTTKTVAFYDNFAQHRADECAEVFGDGWAHIRRPSVIMKDYGAELTVEDARKRRPGKKKEEVAEAA